MSESRDLKRLKALLAAASPAPWTIVRRSMCWHISPGPEGLLYGTHVVRPNASEVFISEPWTRRSTWVPPPEQYDPQATVADAELIVALRNIAPILLAKWKAAP